MKTIAVYVADQPAALRFYAETQGFGSRCSEPTKMAWETFARFGDPDGREFVLTQGG